MNERVNQLNAEGDLSDDKAQNAVAVVVNLLKKRLPAPIAGQLDKVLGKGVFVTKAIKGPNNNLGL